jgi:Tol biopolymer transport system component
MSLEAGKKLGPYEIIEPIGAGGMGEVYKARDTRLDRTVAIKVLPADFADRSDLKERFDREARAVSNLNHPNICALYDVGQEEGIAYLVMEHLEGETLGSRLVKGPLEVGELVRVAIQIAEALDVAHRQGFIHRDLKPGNIMLTRSGAKLLDFGLAKSTTEAAVTDATSAATATSPLTAQGTIMGTFQYMAPEQFEGVPADARSDIFAFGVVLYEMATGARAFEGKTQASLAASILKEEPRPLSALAPMVPPGLERVVQVCMAKEPDDRWQTAHDMALQLRWIADAGSGAGVPISVASKRKHREKLWMGLAIVLALTTAALGVAVLGREEPPRPQYVTSIVPPEGASFVSAGQTAGPVVLSPDGSKMVFSATDPEEGHYLWIRDLTDPEPRRLQGTQDGMRPFWSPDSKHIGFFSAGKMRRIELLSGSVLSVCDASDGRGGTWNKDGIIVFSPTFRSPIYKVDANGGTPEPVTELDPARAEGTHRYPWFLPDGDHFLYLSRRTVAGTPQDTVVYVASLKTGEKKILTQTESNTIYSSGHLLTTRERTLLAHPFDLNSLEFTGDPVSLAKGLLVDQVYSRAVISASEQGVLIYQQGNYVESADLVWFDRQGNKLGVLEAGVSSLSHSISPGQDRVAMSLAEPGPGQNIWIHDLSRGVRTRLTFSTDIVEGFPQWSPDGSEIHYTSTQEGSLKIFKKSSSGAGKEELLAHQIGDAWPTSWSRDGKHLLFTSLGNSLEQISRDIWVMSIGEEPTLFIDSKFEDDYATFSPDGNWVAYSSNSSGRDEIYVTAFPDAQGRWQISSNGGSFARWRGDGEEIFYLAPGGKAMATEVQVTESQFQIGESQTLFTMRISSTTWMPFDAAADGQKFLINVPLELNTVSPLTLVLNWTEALKNK